MADAHALIDLAPLVRLMALALLLAALPLAWVWLRAGRDAADGSGSTRSRLAALTAVTLFLTFDLIVFGSFTRLSDSGLGCPDWPGCYGEVSPWGAKAEIAAAQAALPSGPVTFSKAWIEMIHRYLAMTVGVLILVMCAVAWKARLEQRRGDRTRPPVLPISPWWPTLTLLWVLVQGAFGKYTVTLKLYPLVVTLHLLGGLLLLALLAMQHEAFHQRPLALLAGERTVLRRWLWAALAVVSVQVALGGWVSTNYAVLACTGFPTCNGQWWPAMDWAQGFDLVRRLGEGATGGYLPVEALVSVHMAHRLFALVVTALLLGLAAWLWRQGSAPLRRFAGLLLALLALQIASGLSNVVLGWPIVAALLHSAGAAALVGVLTLLLARCPAASAQPVQTGSLKSRAVA
jgi:cytochrome c oxidase assembly protein subunit 15